MGVKKMSKCKQSSASNPEPDFIHTHVPVVATLFPAVFVFLILGLVIFLLKGITFQYIAEKLRELIIEKHPLRCQVACTLFAAFLIEWNRYLILVHEAKDKKDKMSNAQLELYQEWKRRWPNDRVDCTIKRHRTFFELFTSSYELTDKKRQSNRKGNFFWKGAFLVTVIIILAAFLRLMITQKDDSIYIILLDRGAFFIVLTLAAGVVAKWLDIKRYQETWARHSQMLHKMNTEMLCYVENLPPYQNSKDAEVLFITRISSIWDDNQMKFTKNMEGKEMALMDLVTQFQDNKIGNLSLEISEKGKE